jgi:hypothetical protein
MQLPISAMRRLTWPLCLVLLAAGSALAQQAAAPPGSPAATITWAASA